MLIPFANEDVAVDVFRNVPPEIVNPFVELNPPVRIPPANVDVAVVVAFTNPNVGEDEDVKVWTVPEEEITKGPCARKVCDASVRPLRDVIAPTPASAPHWKFPLMSVSRTNAPVQFVSVAT